MKIYHLALGGIVVFVASPFAAVVLGHWAWGSLVAWLGLLAFSVAVILTPDEQN